MQAAPWIFHPFELAFVGYKNSGKTRLLAALAARLAGHGFQVGYLKRDAHGFQMDHPGKDTQVLAQAGARWVMVADAQRQALLRPASVFPGPGLDLLEPDLLLVEGHKGLRLPRLALLDGAGALLADPALGAYPPVAVIHPGECPPLPWDVPRWHRDDLDGIEGFVRRHLAARAAAVPVHGLVLTGGRSTRMGSDKAQLQFGGRRLADRVGALLASCCAQVFISCRADQASLPGRQGRPQIHDILLDHGPIGGLLSAFHAHPEAAWLVLACDLPNLTPETLERLTAGRNPYRFATAFQGDQDRPEPLCTLYEPKSRLRLWQFLAAGQPSPRDFLRQSPIALLERRGHELEDVNTPEQREAARLL
jgi:molybdopterin-guanine dinucleotide biosynthesis protein MobB